MSDTPFTFKAVFAFDSRRSWMIKETDEIIERGGSSSSWMSLNVDGTCGAEYIDWSSTLICVPGSGENRRIIITGPDGKILELTKTDDFEHHIDPSDRGPKVYGAIRDLRVIGEHVYAVGMRRQVYRREDVNQWVHVDQDVLQPPLTTDIAGFNSIDGLSEEELYAAGFGGEIWRCESGRWSVVDSPTNVILNKVLAANGSVYACGQSGVVLAGRGNVWDVVATAPEDLWDMAWFNGQLWLAGDEHLFVLEDAQVREVAIEYVPKGRKKKRKDPTVAALSSAGGVLWSVGRKHVLWTDDGKTWTDVTP